MYKLLAILIICAFVQSQVIVGGFKRDDRNNCKDMMDQYAEQKNLWLANAQVVECRTQVVAGMNYSMMLSTDNGVCMITIYRDFTGDMSVNNSYKDSCSANFQVNAQSN